jgi:hypothetical protein
MRHISVFVILLFLIACLEADDKRTLDMVKLKDGSLLLGKIVEKADQHLVLEVHGVQLKLENTKVFSVNEDLPDPGRFSFPTPLPEGVKKWQVPVYWLKEQIFRHELRAVDLYEIAVDFETQKLYLRGYGLPTVPEVTDSLYYMPSQGEGYYEQIPPD